MRVDVSLLDSYCCSQPVFNATIQEDCTGGLIIEMFDDSDKVGADVVLLHGCPQSLKSMKTMVEVLLVLELFLKEDSSLKICSVVLLPALQPARSSAMTFSACCFNLFSMIVSMTLLGWLMKLIVR